MRRAVLPLGLCAALVAVSTSAAGGTRERVATTRLARYRAALATSSPASRLFRIQAHGTRVRKGEIQMQPANPRVRVVAELRLPPLAARYGRVLAGAGDRHKLNVHSRSARLYVARLDAAQELAARELRAAIPQAHVQERFQVVLDAITVDLPNRSLPRLLRLHTFRHVFPSLQYTPADDTSPSVIGAPTVEQQLGVNGSGMKIAVVDDGIDQTNAFFNPAGYSYPAGFPKGNTAYTTPKVIVARSFPGPGSGAAGKLPLDPKTSFHGTHVAGIAAGDAGTTAPASPEHPSVSGLTGVAPKAWLGNYRVFTVPTPLGGDVADTPEIIAAFESAVRDGMDVINFSGGGPQTDPANDALMAAVHNVTAAGVVAVIAAGNDRDQVGDGSVGSPGTAPDAITVAAVSNTHVFAPALSVAVQGAPSDLTAIPFQGAGGESAPTAWSTKPHTLVDVATITGTDGKPVDRHLCGSPGNLASPKGQLPAGSLHGEIALAQRGLCPFETKAEQALAAGAIGIVLVDNRQGEADPIPIPLSLPAGMISNLDGADLEAFMDAADGKTQIEVGETVQDLNTGRSGVITSFSSSGPTAFGHDLKPDVAAPGAQVVSATLRNTDPSRFAVFDGTSMATPHVSGAAALLLELHPTWTPAEVKSALVSTAAPAWADTARTKEAAVTDEGGGLVWLPRAVQPLLFTAPASLSFEDLNVLHGAAEKPLLLQVTDAGSGSGSWTVTVDPQAATTGAWLSVPGTATVAPGGETDIPVVAHASAAAVQGENYGFIVLTRGSDTRRVPYLFLVDRPALARAKVHPLVPGKWVLGDTRTGTNRVTTYRFPTAPFGNAPDTPPMDETGREHVYSLLLDGPAENAGVSMVLQGTRALADPWFLGSLDESTVQGYAGTPTDVNELTYDYGLQISAAGASYPSVQRFYVSVDAGLDPWTGKSLAGTYLLRSWVNDVTPPTLRLLTTRVVAGRPLLALRTVDSQSGVDPYSLVLGYQGALVGAAYYDPVSGIALFPLPKAAPRLQQGKRHVAFESSDFQEAKNIDTPGTSLLPNTRTKAFPLRVVHRPVVDWLAPAGGGCVSVGDPVLVSAAAPAGIGKVRFLLDGHRLANARKQADGLWFLGGGWRKAKRGRHLLRAVAVAKNGRTVSSTVHVRACK
ncbi:MAG TPA: S8 family serine peptidase [Gaiellaceae bacterium]|nr:S8 family serine peptidase [Gaiellaceae bacterium]